MKHLSVILVLALSCAEVKQPTNSEEKKYLPTWESLSEHNAVPQWLQDAKLGIYFHWGVYAVPAFSSEWYPSKMYIEGTKEYEHHRKTYGDQSEFGYHHFIEDFNAEHFDATEWANLFEKAGAKFAGPVAQHHDGFAMWDSEINPWNAADMGPEQDITGELAKALRSKGLKLVTTFHHARNLQRNRDQPDQWGEFNSHFTYNPDWHTSSTDPKLSKFYGNIPEKEFHDYWKDQVVEVIDKYQPDIIWFDSWLRFIPDEYKKEMIAYYFNNEAKNDQQVAIAYKQLDLPTSVGIHDIEQGGRRDITEKPWMTDITLSFKSWGYIDGQTYKPASMVIRNLIDVVSKNGIVLLNISPKADGTIPPEQKDILLEMGSWFSKHGEAIYDTKPWALFGFGNARAGEGSHGGQSSTVKYTAEDIRFTQSKDEKTLYMFCLGQPQRGKKIWLKLLAKHRYAPLTPIKRITLLGSDTEVAFDHAHTGLTIVTPDAPMNEFATVFKMELE
ncbi:MAG: alpha-L-fucosidase [Cyclobacteriaceae bacterium]